MPIIACVIATHGRPYHRMTGTRMFDSLLIVESEPVREFEFTIDFDQPFPLRTAVDAMTPPIVTQIPATVPTSMTSSWILGLSARNVELIHSKVRPATDDASEELSLFLTETEGVTHQMPDSYGSTGHGRIRCRCRSLSKGRVGNHRCRGS